MATNTNRDDFTASTKRMLRERAGNLCSLCEISTLAASTNDTGILSQGVAAHIHAAAPLGPRANANLDPTQRSAHSNGIWLCANCAMLIDRDVASFPPEQLHALKRKREEATRAELGKRPGEREAQRQLVSALTAYPVPGTRPAIIANAHRATQIAMEQLDSRVRVESRFDGAGTRFDLHPLEPFQLTLTPRPSAAPSWGAQFQRLKTHGEGELDVAGAKVVGSALFEYIVSAATVIQVSALHKGASVRVELEGPDGLIVPFATLNGRVTGGTEALRFAGDAWDGVFAMSFEVDLAGKRDSQSVSFTFDLDRWVEQPLRHVPYVQRLGELAGRLAKNWRLKMSFEIEGREAFSASATPDAQVLAQWQFYRYLAAAQRLAKLVDHDARLRPSVPITYSELEDLVQISEEFDMKRDVRGRDYPRPITLQPSPALAQHAGAPRLSTRCAETQPRSATIFGQPITLPLWNWHCFDARVVLRADGHGELVLAEDAPVTMSLAPVP